MSGSPPQGPSAKDAVLNIKSGKDSPDSDPKGGNSDDAAEKSDGPSWNLIIGLLIGAIAVALLCYFCAPKLKALCAKDDRDAGQLPDPGSDEAALASPRSSGKHEEASLQPQPVEAKPSEPLSREGDSDLDATPIKKILSGTEDANLSNADLLPSNVALSEPPQTRDDASESSGQFDGLQQPAAPKHQDGPSNVPDIFEAKYSARCVDAEQRAGDDKLREKVILRWTNETRSNEEIAKKAFESYLREFWHPYAVSQGVYIGSIKYSWKDYFQAEVKYCFFPDEPTSEPERIKMIKEGVPGELQKLLKTGQVTQAAEYAIRNLPSGGLICTKLKSFGDGMQGRGGGTVNSAYA